MICLDIHIKVPLKMANFYLFWFKANISNAAFTFVPSYFSSFCLNMKLHLQVKTLFFNYTRATFFLSSFLSITMIFLYTHLAGKAYSLLSASTQIIIQYFLFFVCILLYALFCCICINGTKV